MPDESLDSIAERLERAADRYQSTGFLAVAQTARDAAQSVRIAPSVESGLALEQAFLTGHALSGAVEPARSWWWRLTHPSSWGSSDDLTDDS